MLDTAFSVVMLLITLWALCRIFQFVLRMILGLVSVMMCVLLLAVAIFGLLVIFALRAFLR
jgi:hypothetical protein